MKLFFLTLLLLFATNTLFSQSTPLALEKKLTVLDNDTRLPIASVHILDSLDKTGYITNEEGRVSMVLSENNSIKVSHIAYQNRSINLKDLKKIDTILLKSQTVYLEEVAISNIESNIDIKQMFKSILDQYRRHYYLGRAITLCTYKEKLEVEDSIMRLFQVQLKYLSKQSIYNPSKVFKHNKFELLQIDYFKKLDTEITSSGNIPNQNLIKFWHLNFLLSFFMQICSDIEIMSVNYTKENIEVTFNSNCSFDNGEPLFSHQMSKVVFDKSSKSIKYLKYKLKYDYNLISDVTEEEKIDYQYAIDNHIIELGFNHIVSSKLLSLSYFKSELIGDFILDEKTNSFKIYQELYMNKYNKYTDLTKGKQIDLTLPFYKNIPEHNGLSHGHLLTLKEKIFLDK